jgi:hypothetical protein
MKRSTEEFVKANYSSYEQGALLSYAVGMSLITNQQAEASLHLFRQSIVYIYNHILVHYFKVDIDSDELRNVMASVEKASFYGYYDQESRKFYWNEDFIERELRAMRSAVKEITVLRNSRYQDTYRLSDDESNLIKYNAKMAVRMYFTKIRKSTFHLEGIVSEFTMEQQHYIKDLFSE